MTDRPNPPRNERPSLTPDRNVEAAVRDSFPASDPPAPTAAQGVRATPVEHLAESTPLAPHPDAIRVTRRFADAEGAKLALESLVREAPLDRRSGRIEPDGAGAMLTLTLPPGDRARVEAMLARLADAGPARG